MSLLLATLYSAGDTKSLLLGTYYSDARKSLLATLYSAGDAKKLLLARHFCSGRKEVVAGYTLSCRGRKEVVAVLFSLQGTHSHC